MKKIINILASVVLLFGASTVAQAQEVDYEAGHNFITVQGGAQATLTHYNITDLITPQFALSFGRYFNDKFGTRLHFQGYQVNGGFKADRYEGLAADQKYGFKAITGDMDFLVNMTNVLCPNRTSHLVDWVLLAGWGVNVAWDKDEFNALTDKAAWQYYYGPMAEDDRFSTFNGRVGTQVNFNVAKNFAIGVELDANYKNDQFNFKFNGQNDWQVAAFVGLTYKFGVKTKKVAEPEPEPVPAPAPAPVVKPEPKPEPAPVVKKDEPLKETFFYQIRMSDVNDDAKLAKIVKWCNEYPNKTIVVSGYADKGTGNPRINKKYAEQRAFKVADAIKAKGVSADRIMVESYGDTVQPFADNDQNRCTIVVGE